MPWFMGWAEDLSIKRIKRAFKHLIRWIKYHLNPDSLTEKEIKKVEEEIEFRSHFSLWGNICRYLCGLGDLKIRFE